MIALLETLVFVAFSAAWAVKAGYPPIADEVDFMKPLVAWIQQGPRAEGMWHSPFYNWLLMGLGRVYGDSLAVSRSVGLVSALIMLLCVRRATQAVAPALTPGLRCLVLAVVALNPATISTALLLDYDTTLLVAATALYFTMLLTTDPSRRLLFLGRTGVALALCFMGKETTPLVYPIGVFVLVAASGKGWGRAILDSAAVAIIGAGLFLGAAALWCKAYHVHMPRMFDMDLLGLKIHGGAAATAGYGLARSLWVKLTPVLWMGLPGAFLFASALSHPKKILKEPGLAAVLSVVLAVLGAYTLALGQKTYHFPKYMAPALPWALWIGLMANRHHFHDATPLKYTLFAAVLGIWHFLAPNPLLILHDRDAQSLIIYLIVAGLPFAAAAFMVRPHRLALAVAGLMAVVAHVKQGALTSRSITYWYGDTALVEAPPRVQAWVGGHPQGELYSPAKDLAWTLRGFGVEYQPRDLLAGNAESLCRSRSPLLIVTRDREDSSLSRATELARLRECLKPTAVHDDLVMGSNR